MKLACLMPTYGRPRLVSNAIACFLAQDHPAADRRLLILDDAGQIEPQEGDGWRVWSTSERYPTLTAKYTALLALLADWWPAWEAIALQDDDDIYGPQWLSSHARALASPLWRHGTSIDPATGQTIHWDDWSEPVAWSYPYQVYSLYGVDTSRGQRPIVEPTAGRFWATAAVRRGLLDRTGGFLQTPLCTFDQQHLALWQREGGEPGRPDAGGQPQFVYGWGRSYHCSGRMDRADWYDAHPLIDRGPVERLVPAMDAQTRLLYRLLWQAEPG